MRIVFLIPELRRGAIARVEQRLAHTRLLHRLVRSSPYGTTEVSGGALNLMRHCLLARSLGADAVLATKSGHDRYGSRFGIGPLPTIRWSDRRPQDLCVVPDVFTSCIDGLTGPVAAYLQHPFLVRCDFDPSRSNVRLWTDSPLMLALCQRTYPGKPIALAPNVVDPEAFPFLPQSQRKPGELVAFPRKGSAFIDDVEARYAAAGGRYWRFERVHGLPFHEFAQRMRTPQAFLASADVEGCALPPQECMAAGIVVVGKDAGGANYIMRNDHTAVVADTDETAAEALQRLEDPALRERIAKAAHEEVRRFFPDAEPTRFWRALLREIE